MIEVWSEEFVSEITFSKNCSFDFHAEVINPKLRQKGLKLLFHVPMVIKRWRSIVKGNLSWNIPFWNHYLKILKFDSPWWRHQPRNGLERSKLVFHVPMLIETGKSKVNDTLRWIIPLWNCSLKILKFWLKLVTSSTQNWLEKGPKLASHVLMVIERWKSKVKETLKWGIRLWNYLLKILKF